MTTADLLLAIDQGTTSTRVIAFDRDLRIVASAARPIATRHPVPGWVEQDPDELVESVVATVETVLDAVGGRSRVAAVGLDNQGETVVAWDAETGRPLAPAIVWQCRRSEPIVHRLRERGLEPQIQERTGLPLDPYFSASKLTWLLEEVPAVAAAGRAGTLRFGTVDAWITARLGDDGIARTDPSTASRTQLFALDRLAWDPQLLAWFGVDGATLPRIVATAGDLGELAHPRWGGSLRLTAMACDQQAALAGHAGLEAGALKATYGTGVFVLVNAGTVVPVAPRLEVSVGWTLAGERTIYVLQGGMFTAGTLVDWLRDGLGLVERTADLEPLARSVADTAGIELLPALAGLGAPWYRADARGTIGGLTAGATRAHLARAALDAIAHRVADIVEAAVAATGTVAAGLRVDGGLTDNGYLMERQADLLGVPVEVATTEESTALGIAGLAGRGAGLLGVDTVVAAAAAGRRIEPRLTAGDRRAQRDAWRAFVARATRR